MAKATDLVIVESPSKAKTIGKYLGPGYTVTASMGHLRDLPKSKLGVDLEHDFEPEYIPVKDKKQLIDELKQESKKASVVYLATDPDREGEAISWHLKELLGLSDEKARRVTFNEITKKVVTESIKNPRDIDQDLVDAQQARRVLDRIVGYQISPLLWRKVKRGLSAGRVQSVATRMVVDREEEIRAFNSEEYWLLDAFLHRPEDEGSFRARFYGRGGKKQELHNEDDVNAVRADVEKAPFAVTSVKKSEKTRKPAPPFITSTLQQEASRRLNMTPRRTMAIAQQLYEGVEITGRGSIGLITYMRTDSLRLSEEAIAAARGFIRDTYGEGFLPRQARRYKAKAGAQDAHEAIRPTDVTLTPELVRKDLQADQYRLYRLIWGRFTACQMADAVFDNVAAEIESAGWQFRANHSVMKFPGFTRVYEESSDDDQAPKQDASALPDLQEGESLLLDHLTPEQQFTQPPARYTEATLIRAMEEKGIGRPSTYAPTISTITAHDYVMKEGKYLKPTPLGEVVTRLMKDHFTDIVDLKFTNQMEEKLDEIESGKMNWHAVLRDFYDTFDAEMKQAEAAMDGQRIKVPDIVSDEVCDVCGKPMLVKKGRFGPFLGCSGFPECTFTKPIVEVMPGTCPKCGSRILKRTSKKGYVFYACERGTDCGFITWDVPTKEVCPTCGKTLFKPGGRGPRKKFCVNEACPEFVPEEKRRYPKKNAASPAEGEASGEPAEARPDAKKTASAKASGASSARKTAAKKTTSSKTSKAAASKKATASKKTAEKKTAASKKTTATKKTTTRKTKAGEENDG